MEKSKYYTPVIEEFHVGFEFESNYILFYELGVNTKYWNKIILSDRHNWFYDSYVNDAVPTEFRVKYLDKEDIESLGFHSEDNGECYNKIDKFDLYGLYPWEWERGIKYLYKITNNSKDVFIGIIKNKSELKKLLKQLGI